jgi:hypothetical protein
MLPEQHASPGCPQGPGATSFFVSLGASVEPSGPLLLPPLLLPLLLPLLPPLLLPLPLLDPVPSPVGESGIPPLESSTDPSAPEPPWYLSKFSPQALANAAATNATTTPGRKRPICVQFTSFSAAGARVAPD